MPLLLMRLLFTSLGKPPVPLGLRTLGGVIGKGAQKRTSIRNWKPMRALLTGIWQITPVCRRAVKYGGYPDELPLFALLARGGIAHLDHINAWKARVEMRPARQRAIQQGGPFTIPGG